MSALTALDDLFRPSLADIQALSVELGTALGVGPEWSPQLVGATFVASSRDRGRQVVVGCGGGWRGVHSNSSGTPEVSQVFLTAAEAVACLGASP